LEPDCGIVLSAVISDDVLEPELAVVPFPVGLVFLGFADFIS
jgi:hypothetical protein